MNKATKELSVMERRILRLWLEGLSGSEIAVCLGTTKGTIMGKIHRMRKAGIDTGRPAPPRQPEAKKPEEGKKAKPKPKKSRTIRVYFPPKPNINTKPYLTLMELKHSSCRYVVNSPDRDGVHLFCGSPIQKGAYCGQHAELCYTSLSVVRTRMKKKTDYRIGVPDVRG